METLDGSCSAWRKLAFTLVSTFIYKIYLETQSPTLDTHAVHLWHASLAHVHSLSSVAPKPLKLCIHVTRASRPRDDLTGLLGGTNAQ